MAAAGLIYGSFPHYIDHLAPLCDILDIPLIVTEEEIESTIRAFYPSVKVFYTNSINAPKAIISNFDFLFVCTPKPLFDEVFFLMQCLLRKSVRTIWCPHGNSDKGHSVACMEALDKEELSLVYGEKMLDFLKEKNSFSCLKSYVKTGNYRKAYYSENKAFYDQKVNSYVLNHLPSHKKNILYAPTWKDSERSSSFEKALPLLIENLPEEFNLVVKPHPNLLLDQEAEQLIKSYQDRKGVLFLNEFPSIYPLLDKMDIYIGDMSSIGYDFLSFKRPMFFLNEQKRKVDNGLYLYRCGIEVHPENYKDIYRVINESKGLSFENTQKDVYDYTFEKQPSLTSLKQQIRTLYEVNCHSNRT